MRDINRIDEFCEVLKTEWKKAPDLRFGQFIGNLFSYVYTTTKKDPFYLEDHEMCKHLQNYLNSIKIE